MTARKQPGVAFWAKRKTRLARKQKKRLLATIRQYIKTATTAPSVQRRRAKKRAKKLSGK